MEENLMLIINGQYTESDRLYRASVMDSSRNRREHGPERALHRKTEGTEFLELKKYATMH